MSGAVRTSGEFWTKHAIERAARYPGLTESDFPAIVRAVLDQKAGLRMKVNGDGHAFLYTHNGTRIAVVVDPAKRLIITFLPPDYFKSGSLMARKQWRSRTDRKIPDDFSSKKRKSRNGGYGME